MKPEPVAKDLVCSVCALPWGDHAADGKGKVDIAECIRLLKLEATRNRCHHWDWYRTPAYPTYPQITWTSTGTGGCTSQPLDAYTINSNTLHDGHTIGVN